MRGDPLLLMVVYGTTLDYRNEEAVERDCRDRLELIRFLFISLSDAAQVPYYKFSLSLFVDFMTEYESIQNSKYEETRKAASAKHLALSRYLLSFYTPAHEQGS